MTGDPIPEKNHVVRNCSAKRLSENNRPLAIAFQMRPKDDYVSVDWLEFHDNADFDAPLDGVRAALRRRGVELKKHARLAELNVGKTKARVRHETMDERELDFKHEPRSNEDSHAGIFNANHDDKHLVVASLIAKSVTNLYPAQAS